MQYPPSELIINDDGSAFHLHVRPEQIAHKIILVGDPARVNAIAAHFSDVECDISNREFHTITGTYQGKRLSAISTGIGCGNIDIVVNELDALTNIDFTTRQDKPATVSMDLVRLGTCGGLQPDTPLGAYVCSMRSIGLDGLLNFYDSRQRVCDTALEDAFVNHMGWNSGWRCAVSPYAAIENESLSLRIAGKEMVKGITISAGGFYAPQGRCLRAIPADSTQNAKLENFNYKGKRIVNYEMEGAALAGLAAILGHKAACVCMVVANRRRQEALTGYKEKIDNLIQLVLDRI